MHTCALTKELLMSWITYKFKNNETVFCPVLNKKLTVTYCNYNPIWIGNIPHQNSDEFWREHWIDSGCDSLQEAASDGWPYNFEDMDEAQSSGFAKDYTGEFMLQVKDGETSYYLTKNGRLITRDDLYSFFCLAKIKSLNLPKTSAFIKKIK